MLAEVNTVLFDYGNTLVLDPFRKILGLKMESFLATLRAEGYVVGHKEFEEAWIAANNETNYQYISHFFQEENIVRDMLLRLGINKTQNLIDKLLSIYREGFGTVVESDLHCKKTRRTLLKLSSRKYILGVLSNEKSDYLEIGLKKANLRDVFDFVLSSEKIGFEKPSQKFFQKAIKILELDKEKTLYVGDDPEADYLAAELAGLKAVLYVRPKSESTPWRRYENKKKLKGYVTVNSLSQLADLL